jgi:UDP:flavonoid glycosyltransferase YjiC (YdhE family)
MRIVLSPMGTTGDIRPFAALYMSLRKLGNEVTMVVPKNGENLCKKFNINYKVIDLDYREFISIIDTKPSLSQLINMLDREISSPFKVLKDLAANADFILGSARNYAVQPIAELYNIPYFQVWHTPQVLESRQHTPWRFTRQNNPAWLNLLLWKIHNIKENRIGSKFVNKNRESLGLQKISDFAALNRENIILVADRTLAPVPADVKANYIQMDYWNLYETEELDKALVEFINAGSKPLFFSFGSGADSNREQTAEIIEKIADALDIRVVIQEGWAGLGNKVKSARVKVIDAAPHYKLFPHMTAAVHLGGAGTVHTAALAGIPQIIIPQYGDQFYYGERVKSLHLGPTLIPKAKLNMENLKEAINHAVSDKEIKENVTRVSDTLKRRENMEDIALKLHNLMLKKIIR